MSLQIFLERLNMDPYPTGLLISWNYKDHKEDSGMTESRVSKAELVASMRSSKVSPLRDLSTNCTGMSLLQYCCCCMMTIFRSTVLPDPAQVQVPPNDNDVQGVSTALTTD